MTIRQTDEAQDVAQLAQGNEHDFMLAAYDYLAEWLPKGLSERPLPILIGPGRDGTTCISPFAVILTSTRVVDAEMLPRPFDIYTMSGKDFYETPEHVLADICDAGVVCDDVAEALVGLMVTDEPDKADNAIIDLAHALKAFAVMTARMSKGSQ